MSRASTPPIPASCPQARKLARIHFDEMLEMAAAGGRVLALRSVEFARNHGVALHVRSSFTWEPGTWVNNEEPSMEDPIISGVVHDVSESKVTVSAVPDEPGVSAALFEPLAAANINVDMIVQNTSKDGTTDISFTMPKADMAVAEKVVADVAAQIGAGGVTHEGDIAKVSLVGAGMKTSPGIAAKMFRVLADEGINIEMISTSTIRISVVVAAAAWSGRSGRSTPRSGWTRPRLWRTPARAPLSARQFCRVLYRRGTYRGRTGRRLRHGQSTTTLRRTSPRSILWNASSTSSRAMVSLTKRSRSRRPCR